MKMFLVVVILIAAAYFLLQGNGSQPTPATNTPGVAATTPAATANPSAPANTPQPPRGMTLQQRIAIMQTAAHTTNVSFDGFTPSASGGLLKVSWVSDNAVQGTEMLDEARKQGAFRDFNVNNVQYGMFMTQDGRRGQRAVFEVYF